MEATLTRTDRQALGWTALFDSLGIVVLVVATTGLFILDGLVTTLFGPFLSEPVPLPDGAVYTTRALVAIVVAVTASLVTLAALPRPSRPALTGFGSALLGTVVGGVVLLFLFDLV